MKKLLYILCGLFVLCQACADDSSDVLDSETKSDETGGGGVTNPQAAACQADLTGAADGWFMQYESTTFWFKFENDGLVKTDSDLPRNAIDAIYNFEPDAETLILSIPGGGHFRYLTTEQKEDKLIVEQFTANSIKCKGYKNGKAMNLTLATAAQVADFKSQKEAFVKLNEQGAMHGVIRNNGALITHYVLDNKKMEVYFSYLENDVVKHQTKTLALGNGGIIWDAVTVDGLELTGVKYDKASGKILAVETGGTELIVVGNTEVMPDYLKSGQEYQIDAAVANVWQQITAFYTKGLRVIEVNFGRSERSLVACLQEPMGGYIFWNATPKDSQLSAVDYELDRVTWKNLGPEFLFDSDVYMDQVTEYLSELLSTYFDTNGFYIVPETTAANTSGKTWYMFSTTGDSWFKVRRAK